MLLRMRLNQRFRGIVNMIKFVIGPRSWSWLKKNRQLSLWIDCKDKSILLSGIGGVQKPYPSIGIELTEDNLNALKEMVAYLEDEFHPAKPPLPNTPSIDSSFPDPSVP